ncbi:MAG: prolipoprotein diacylglyceryl transferase [Pontiellaceae bacterium]|nr:prolipoprotein diacylglyceryl transferase [Pontiellaceae bacterium]MBN2784075.1 prolipoprotein diacylglyceryl transferase [Pontiellaceae bacterium]
MTHLIHHINPIILPITEKIAIRWYGLSYILSFVVTILFLRRWSRQDRLEIAPDKVSDFVIMMAIFGVMLGGRLGYILFYGMGSFLEDPRYLYQVWEGGMSSHGGFIGVILFTYWYARKNKYHFWNLIDNMAAVTSVGFFFGRIANFINGELWGKVSEVKWAMFFPQELGYHYGNYDWEAINKAINTGFLQPRHPSQLYQALCEGLLVLGIMLWLRRTNWGRRPGALSAAYLILYAIARIGMEFFREPDNGQPLIAWISKGQFYSALMIIGALIIAVKMRLFGRQEEPEQQ